jgi:hypothetical protein
MPTVDYENTPTFLIDGVLLPGMSGGPVFTAPTTILKRGQERPALYDSPISMFVGIHSSSIYKPIYKRQKIVGAVPLG